MYKPRWDAGPAAKNPGEVHGGGLCGLTTGGGTRGDVGGYAVCGLGQQGSRAAGSGQHEQGSCRGTGTRARRPGFVAARTRLVRDWMSASARPWVGESCRRLIASGHEGGAEGMGPRLAVRGRRSYWQSRASVRACGCVCLVSVRRLARAEHSGSSTAAPAGMPTSPPASPHQRLAPACLTRAQALAANVDCICKPTVKSAAVGCARAKPPSPRCWSGRVVCGVGQCAGRPGAPATAGLWYMCSASLLTVRRWPVAVDAQAAPWQALLPVSTPLAAPSPAPSPPMAAVFWPTRITTSPAVGAPLFF
ncbi:hypothetical protein PSV08DRAFT_242252 [Bipolaris maydis]|uniref:uncharacterized protein n=1 Tax=Cochliobolus heterostrophus TaxID=5016 RepID=UPI0024DBB9E3|nr:hypothetical protein J3E73DRAFT_261562 [Bipolaris maydis]KAJ5054976.1 hypothetical protein J3E74DRAFT_295057 [Bipolaris maydis]KAJ6275385.1 hypothetical protein PSV08DRAFT_242252 [Bipolaris maydis]KAJ6286574.1 hypothetical protein J3E71DRAFT_235308 [Bipolaris maydis]